MFLLNQPFPYQGNPGKTVLIASVSVFFVLALFQPFGLSYLVGTDKWLRIFGFGLVTALCTTLGAVVMPMLFPRLYCDKNWTWGKYILSTCNIILLITIGNFLFNWSLSEIPAELLFKSFQIQLIITFLVGLIPATLITLFVQNYSLKQNLREAKSLNLHLQSKAEIKISDPSPQNETVTLSGSTKESLSLSPEKFLYAEASGNYVKVYYLSDEKNATHTLLRSTITQIESILNSYNYIRRCHRAFLVNTNQIINVEGNSQGYNLSLKHSKEEIPVSRSYTKDIKEILSKNN